MKFKTKLVHAVVLGALGVAGSAQAVNLSDDGRGEVLIYPYYTVQGGNDTLFSIVNTTNQGKAVKVRIIEGMNSYEVLDFNLYLSPNDAWSAAITADPVTGGGKIVTIDTSCTAPAIPAAGQPFRTYAIQDNGPKTAARTKEGYIEVIEMGEINEDFELVAGGVTFGKAVTHVAGVPGSCAAIRNAWVGGVNGNASRFGLNNNELDANTGGLIGSAAIINVAQGADYSYDPVVLTAFNNTPGGNHTYTGTVDPSLASVTPKVSNIFYGGGVMTTNWAAVAGSLPVDPVSAVLMHQSVLNEYTVNPALNATTDIVLTFPTKRQYVDEVSADRPFTAPFVAANGTATGACEPVGIANHGREEEAEITDIDFSPQPPGGQNALCWEANVITLNNSDVLASQNLRLNYPVTYNDGWISFSFTDVGHAMNDEDVIAPAVRAYQGLPVVGFAVQRYVNSDVSGGVLANYAGAYANKYVRSIVTLP